MNTIHTILDSINGQATARADSVLAEARQRAEEILNKGAADRDAWKRQADETAARECQEILERAEASDQRIRQRSLLETSAQVVDEVIAETKAKIAALDYDAYFDFLFRLYQKSALPRDGVIRFPAADFDRIPEGFLERCKQVFPDNALSIASDGAAVGNGFLVDYGNIVQNCLVEDIFDAERQTLRDRAYEALTASV